MKDSSATALDLMRWSEALAGIARTGLAFTKSLYERERFEEILRVAADIRSVALGGTEPGAILEAWISAVTEGAEGYVTPKVGVGAIVGDEDGHLLLTRRADSGLWYFPVGWADVGYSPSEVAIKEVYEETGMEVEPSSLIAALDGFRWGFSRIPVYTLLFHCRLVGGELRPHPLETKGVAFFARDALPEAIRGGRHWVDLTFAAIEGELSSCHFDPPRTPPWRSA